MPKPKSPKKPTKPKAETKPVEAPKPVGRPSSYTPELAGEICDRISVGATLRELEAQDDMPSMKTIMRWARDNADFRQQYARALDQRNDFWAEEIIEIADDGTNDYVEKRDQEGAILGYRENGEFISRSKVRIETRKWLMGKGSPKKYGEKVAHELTGRDGNPIETKELSPEEYARRIAFGLAKGTQKKA